MNFLAVVMMLTAAQAGANSVELARTAIGAFELALPEPGSDLFKEALTQLWQPGIKVDDPETQNLLTEAAERAAIHVGIQRNQPSPIPNDLEQLKQTAKITDAIVSSRLGDALRKRKPDYFNQVRQVHDQAHQQLEAVILKDLQANWGNVATVSGDDSGDPTPIGGDQRFEIRVKERPAKWNSDPVIESGDVYVTFTYDVGPAINLQEAALKMSDASKASVLHSGPAPEYSNFASQPLHIAQSAAEHAVGHWKTQPIVKAVLYDIGAVGITYKIPISGPFSMLTQLSEGLYGNATLQADSRNLVEELVRKLGTAVTRPLVATTYEDYVVFQIHKFAAPGALARLLKKNPLLVAQVLRADSKLKSREEVDDALSSKVSYGDGDVVVADWASAFIVDPDGKDIRAVLELATVQLLGLRLLDSNLDVALERWYQALSHPNGKSGLFLKAGGGELHQIGRLLVESAVLYESINNALKLIGDQYLARLYEQAAKRYHLDAWGENVEKKLQVLETINEQVEQAVSIKRSHRLEVLIAVLIILELLFEVLRYLR